MTERRLRAYRFTLDPTRAQVDAFLQHAGAARWAYNYANGVLSRFDHAKRDRENSWIEQHHGLTRDQLYELPTEQRKTIQKEARAAVRAENSALTAELKIIDEHRKRVTHKGKPGVEPGPQPDENAPEMAHQLWRERVELAGLQGSDPEAYREQRKKILAEIRPLVNAAKRRLIERGAYQPSAMDISTLWREIRNLPKGEGGSPWWEEVSIYAFTSGFAHAETAWKNHLESLKGIRKGPLVGRPRFKTKRRARKSFTLYGSIQLDTYRRLRVPNQGAVRLHNSGKRLHRAVTKRGGIIKSVTISQGGHRWYASVLVDEPDITPGRETQRGPSPAQRAAGGVGVDIGVLHLAALSTGQIVENPRHVRRAHARLVKAQRALSRTVKGSQRRRRAAARLARLHHQLAERRATHLHGITKLLTTRHSLVAIEDLNVAGMTRSARGTVADPGRNVRAKARLNRAILDVAPGELRRQLEYKTAWYGSTLAVCDRWAPTSKTCSTCGTVKAKLSLSERVFQCDDCGMVLDRDINAARNILAVAVPHVASGTGETLNARGGCVSPAPRIAAMAVPSEAGRPGRSARSPRGSNPPAIPNPQ